jgi:hypothetical protein
VRIGNLVITSGGAGIQFTTNNGNSWIISNIGFNNFYSNSIAAYGNSIYSCGYQQGLAVSSNDGIVWQSVANDLIDRYTSDVASNNNCVLVSTRYKGMVKSTNNGNNWIQCNNGILDSGAKLLFPFNDLIIASGGDYNYRTTNNGENWNPKLKL